MGRVTVALETVRRVYRPRRSYRELEGLAEISRAFEAMTDILETWRPTAGLTRWTRRSSGPERVWTRCCASEINHLPTGWSFGEGQKIVDLSRFIVGRPRQ